MDYFLLSLSLFALLTGLVKFIPNDVLATVAAVAGIVAGVIGLTRVL